MDGSVETAFGKNERLEPFRTPGVMDEFMEALDGAIGATIGLTARIRCFGYESSSIHARN